MSCTGYRLPENATYDDAFNFMTISKFPAILESSVEYNRVLPKVGTYSGLVNNDIVSFMEKLNSLEERRYTLSGVGSFIDYKKYGYPLKRPTPDASGLGCRANSLCVEPTCFGFTEGVAESNNVMHNVCWSLSMPCLKDNYYSNRSFERQIESYFEMFFAQPPGVLEAMIRTMLIEESVKVVCTTTNQRYTGTYVSSGEGMSLPFYINADDPTAFPNLTAMSNAGIQIGAANLSAFSDILAPQLFSGAFKGGMASVQAFGLKSDLKAATVQTMAAMDMSDTMQLKYIASGLSSGGLIGDSFDNFKEDGLFPTFRANTSGELEIVTAEILAPTTIYGYETVSNPIHPIQRIRALLLVPSNWRFELVESPRDDFSALGLGGALNYRTNTPGVFPIMSSSMFASSRISSRDKTVVIGQKVNPKTGMMVPTAMGVSRRSQPLREAVRTDVILTHSSVTCNNEDEGQLPRVGSQIVQQGRADGFTLKSIMQLGTMVKGIARPVLLFFKLDQIRAVPTIEVCNEVEIEVDISGGISLVDCCPGNQIYAILKFTGDATSSFSVNDTAIYRTGARGASIPVVVTAVSGNLVTVQSADETTIIPCCSDSPDAYGSRGELVNTVDPTLTCSEIFGAEYDSGSSSMYIELFKPLAPSLLGATGTIELRDGQTLLVQTVADVASGGVFLQIEDALGTPCSLADLDCTCMLNAIFCFS